MFNVILDNVQQTSQIIAILLMFGLYAFFSFYWESLVSLRMNLKKYHGIQRVHEGEVSRLGGLVAYCGLATYWILCEDGIGMPYIYAIITSSIPLLIISIREDLFYNSTPTQRLLAMLITTWIFFIIYPVNFPMIDVPVLGNLLKQSYLASLIFFSFAILVIMNGNNLIDGANGLMPMTTLIQILCLFYLSHSVDDFYSEVRLILITVPLLIFLLFNYPWGKIFIGDFGAYFYGFIISTNVIIFYGEHPELPTWGAVLILFYPAFELLFSVIRKKIQKLDPTLPDSNHLHLKMFYLLRSKFVKSQTSNALVMPCLSLFWATPFVLLVWVYDSVSMTIFSIILITLMYLGFYWALPKQENK
jgi:UDP-GlcNAc:undecaprenyl-phosphate GlcNAc-1-phosphate transferase